MSKRAPNPHRPSARAIALGAVVLVGGAVAASCGGGDSNTPPPPPPSTQLTYDAADPCTAKVPQPNDVFRGADGVLETVACTPPTDPVEAALSAALADEGVALDTVLTIPADGDIDVETLTATATFSLTGTSTSAPLPATILVAAPAGAATSTRTSDWRVVAHVVDLDGTTLRVTPNAALDGGSYYVAITTDTIEDDGGRAITAAPATKALVGTTTITAGAFEGLDAATATRLERERQRLRPVLTVLERAGLPRAKIRSIQGFTTALGFARLERMTAAYRKAITDGRLTYQLETVGGDIAPADVYPPGTPPAAYASVQAFRRGTIRVPKLLDDAGVLRADWATNVQTIRIPFLASVPRGGTGYRVVIYVPGFGRSKLDARELANAFAGAPRAAVIGLDIRCHGDRARDAAGACKEERTAQEIAALTDVTSNGNPERSGADGVPDDSGAGLFVGDARALRDGLLASVIEVMHVVETFQRGGMAVTMAGLSPSPSDTHILAHGHAAAIAALVATQTRSPIRTVTFPSGGSGVARLVMDGPAPLKNAFLATLPAGIEAAGAEAYLTRLEATVLAGVDVARAAPTFRDRYVRAAAGSPRVLLPHGAAAQYVSQAARQSLIDALDLDTLDDRVSRHNGECDDFYLHVCRLGDNVAWGERARDQLGSFVGSGGVTVLAPAN
ncbi:Ig-like domain-containing protein [Myxococcota bacterium]|nr:Ig-like domain-containing protein [Myxococcota bacterium]